MSARAWGERRSKKGLAARAYPRIERAMRRDKDKPLPREYKGRLPSGGRLTVTLSAADHEPYEEDW